MWPWRLNIYWPNCCIALSALQGSSSVMWTLRRWFFTRRSACREIPELAASEMMAMFWWRREMRIIFLFCFVWVLGLKSAVDKTRNHTKYKLERQLRARALNHLVDWAKHIGLLQRTPSFHKAPPMFASHAYVHLFLRGTWWSRAHVGKLLLFCQPSICLRPTK